MIKFLDGPAISASLMLRRAPKFLRVVRDGKGKFDALDQLNDKPRWGETLFAYRRIGCPGRIHINPGGYFAMATYKMVEPQPDEATMLSTASWREWCLAKDKEQAAT